MSKKSTLTALSFNQAEQAITTVLRAKLVPMVKGSPGTGKSALVRKIAADNNLKLIDIRLSQVDPTELLGFPRIEGDRADYVPMAMFPLEGDDLPFIEGSKDQRYSGWMLFFDEMNAAPHSVQVASYKIMLERLVGNRKLHDKVAMVGAGNLDTDRAVTEEMSTALQSRLVHLQLESRLDDFLDYAYEAGFNQNIINFLQFKPTALYTFKPDHSDSTYACNRTWEFADRILKVNDDFNDPILRVLLSGTISTGVASEFIGFCQTKVPNIKDILKEPETFEVPKEPSVMFALIGHLFEFTTKDNFNEVYKYVSRIGREFQFLFMRSIFKRKPELRDRPEVQEWLNIQVKKLK